MDGASGASSAEARTRRGWIVAAVVVALLAVTTLAAGRAIASRTEAAQVTAYWSESPTTLVVVYVRAADGRLVEASADETASRVIVNVTISAPRSWGGSYGAGAIYTSATITLAAPLGDREVVTVDGDSVNEGRYPFPLPVDTP